MEKFTELKCKKCGEDLSQMYDSILLEIEQAIPEEQDDEDIYDHYPKGFNSCRSEILSGIKKLKDE